VKRLTAPVSRFIYGIRCSNPHKPPITIQACPISPVRGVGAKWRCRTADATGRLQDTGQPEVVPEIIATRIIAAAKFGELRVAAVSHLATVGRHEPPALRIAAVSHLATVGRRELYPFVALRIAAVSHLATVGRREPPSLFRRPEGNGCCGLRPALILLQSTRIMQCAPKDTENTQIVVGRSGN
jgi:hypothetical protein